MGALRTKYDTGDDEENARINGYILSAAVMLSYLTAGPLFIISGNIYAEQITQNKQKLRKLEHSKTNSQIDSVLYDRAKEF